MVVCPELIVVVVAVKFAVAVVDVAVKLVFAAVVCSVLTVWAVLPTVTEDK